MWNTLPTLCYCMSFIILLYFQVKYRTNIAAKYINIIWIASSSFAFAFQYVLPGPYEDITLLPYIFLFICFLISLWPIIKLTHLDSRDIEQPQLGLFKVVIYFFIAISIVPFYENFIHVIRTYDQTNNNLAEIYEDKMSGLESIDTYWLSSIGRIGNSLDGIFIDFLFFAFFYLLLNHKINKWLIILSIIPFANHLLFQLAMAGRATVAIYILTALYLILIFKKVIGNQRVKYIKLYGLILAGLLAVGLLIISFSRKEATNANDSNLEFFGYYLGKGHLDFNKYVWNKKESTQGDNCFSFFKSIIGLPTYENYLDRRNYWSERKTGVPPALFSTYIGDLCMDMNIIFVIPFLLFSSHLLKKRLQGNKPLTLMQLFIFIIYSRILIQGWAFLPYKTYGSTRNLVLSFILLYTIIHINQYIKSNIQKR